MTLPTIPTETHMEVIILLNIGFVFALELSSWLEYAMFAVFCLDRVSTAGLLQWILGLFLKQNLLKGKRMINNQVDSIGLSSILKLIISCCFFGCRLDVLVAFWDFRRGTRVTKIGCVFDEWVGVSSQRFLCYSSYYCSIFLMDWLIQKMVSTNLIDNKAEKDIP